MWNRDGNEENDESPDEWYRKMAERYQEELDEIHQRRERSETRFSLWIIMSSLMGAAFLFVISSGLYVEPAGVEELLALPAGFFAVLAFAGAVGIVQLAIFDVILGINALR